MQCNDTSYKGEVLDFYRILRFTINLPTMFRPLCSIWTALQHIGILPFEPAELKINCWGYDFLLLSRLLTKWNTTIWTKINFLEGEPL